MFSYLIAPFDVLVFGMLVINQLSIVDLEFNKSVGLYIFVKLIKNNSKNIR